MPQMWTLLDKKDVPVIYTASEKIAIQSGTTMYYWALVCGQVGAAFAATTTSMSLATYGIPNNWLNLFIILEFGCSIAVIYHTDLQHAFGMKALTLRQMLAGSCALRETARSEAPLAPAASALMKDNNPSPGQHKEETDMDGNEALPDIGGSA